MEHLIFKYLQGNLSLDEQHELSKWIQSDEQNAETLKKIYAYWHYHKGSLDKEELEVRLRLLRMMHEDRSESLSGSGISRTFFRIAASVILVCSSIFALYQYTSNSQPQKNYAEITLVEKVSLPGQKIITILPDGSKVKLNADSKIIVPSRFEGENREVTLIGEAFFDVKKDEQHPFIIKTKKIDIRVLGTSFNVRAYSDGAPEVAVKTGKVSVKNGTSEAVELAPDQMVQLDGNSLIKMSISRLVEPFAWTNHRLVFYDESFAQVLQKVSRWYGVQVEIKGHVTTDKNYTANYDNPTVNELMDVLAFVYDFKYEFNENEKKITIQ